MLMLAQLTAVKTSGQARSTMQLEHRAGATGLLLQLLMLLACLMMLAQWQQQQQQEEGRQWSAARGRPVLHLRRILLSCCSQVSAQQLSVAAWLHGLQT